MSRTGGRSVVTPIAIAAIAAIVVSCTDTEGGSPAAAPTDPDRSSTETLETLALPATSTSVPELPSPASAEVVRDSRRYLNPEPLGPLAMEHGIAPTLLPPGAHTTDVLGIEMTLDLDDWWQMTREIYGTVQLVKPDTPIGIQLPTLLFERPVGLADPARVSDENLLPGEYPVPPEELATWIDEVEQIELVATGPAAAGDRTGRWYEIMLDASSRRVRTDCDPGPCIHNWWSGASVTVILREGELMRIYAFDDPNGPIFVTAAADPDDEAWMTTIDELIRNTTFGPSAPHPVPDGVAVGAERAHERGDVWRFAEFPGVVIEGAAISVSRQRRGSLGYEPWGPAANRADSSIVRPLQDAEGVPMETIDDVIAVLDASGLEREADETIFDTTAAVFTGLADEPIFRRAPLDDGDPIEFVSWPDQLNVRVWAFDSPIGPLLIAAEANGSADLAVGTSHAERLFDLMSFDCSDGACDRPPASD